MKATSAFSIHRTTTSRQSQFLHYTRLLSFTLPRRPTKLQHKLPMIKDVTWTSPMMKTSTFIILSQFFCLVSQFLQYCNIGSANFTFLRNLPNCNICPTYATYPTGDEGFYTLGFYNANFLPILVPTILYHRITKLHLPQKPTKLQHM